MKPLAELLRRGRGLRAVGFDDAPFDKAPGSPVSVAGVVCRETRLEGMLWGEAHRDGEDATRVMRDMLLGSKFHAQVHLVLIDGLAIGGFNLVDLPALAEAVARPCVAVMRRPPNLPAVHRVLRRFEDAERRLALLERAGPIHELGGFVFQVAGEAPEPVAQALAQLTDRGQVPEPLRLAHLIGSAVKLGQSGKRA
ncbi:MAG: DUF99 family protein [Alphaproteobacteria bacterium]|nr:DUF99 family protein [Alphaproteobacteria bacterium]MCB9792033.1 DUF99 family protein [Alphaproteobacteria bacterium]